MKGYKAFAHGMICCKGEPNEKQYAEHTTYEEAGGEICNEGMMHFCLNPLDCLDFYPLIDDDGNMVEIAEVEVLETPITDDNKKFATKKLHIGAKIDIKKIGSISAQVIRENVERETKGDASGGNGAKQVGGYGAKQVGGDCAQQVGGNCAKQVGGYEAKQVGGYEAKQVGGYGAQQIGGYRATQIGGYHARQVGGDRATQVGGYGAQQVGGYRARQQASENSVLVAAENSRFKAGLHSVILHYWHDNDGNIGGFKAVQVDGVSIKADTWYELRDGEFAEV